MSKILPVLCLLWGGILIPTTTNGQSVTPSAKTILQFADDLYQQHDYYRAITEYKRFLYYYPHEDQQFEAAFKIGRCYQYQQKWQLALDAYRSLAMSPPPPYWQQQAYLFSTITAYQVHQYEQALAYNDTLLSICQTDRECQTKASLLRGLIFARQFQWQNAQASFAETSLPSLADQKLALPHRSPYLAGMLSTLIPGMGQTYCGRWRDGGFAFLLVSSLGWAAYQANQDEHQPRLYVFGTMTAFFYLGNIYGAIVRAIQFNHMANVEHFREIEHKIKTNGQLNEVFE